MFILADTWGVAVYKASKKGNTPSTARNWTFASVKLARNIRSNSVSVVEVKPPPPPPTWKALPSYRSAILHGVQGRMDRGMYTYLARDSPGGKRY